MTFPSVTCSRLAGAFVALVLSTPTVACAALVTGSVELAPATHVKNEDASGVVIWLEPLTGSAAPAPRRARMLQKDKTFSPHVLPISVGSAVDFPNLDPIFHNAFSNFNGQIFDIGLYPPGKSRTVTFRRPGVVRVFCNIHPAMSAVIVVLDSLYYTVAGRDGRYSIPDVAPGAYRLRVFDERATPEVLNGLSREVQVTAGRTVLPPVQVPETAYIPLAHANKFGKAYPHGSGEPGYGVPQ